MENESNPTTKRPAEERKERLKAALRENLRRRKAPAMEARTVPGQGGNTKPASKSEP
jgi:hypothetical protein